MGNNTLVLKGTKKKRLNSVTTLLILAIIGIISLFCITIASAQTEAHPWDVNGDGVVDLADLMFIGKYLKAGYASSADVNGDGSVNIADMVLVCVHFGERYNEIIGSDGAPMVLIPAGEFMMGDHHGGGWADERPVHAVYLDAFYIDKYEVTNAQYARFLNEYGKVTDPAGHTLIYIDNNWCKIIKDGDVYKPMAGYERHPVVRVSWYGAAAYAQSYGKRLPTEAEWERAARGTYVGEGNYKKYVWGDEWPPPKGAGNFDSQYIDGYHDDYPQTAPVGSFSPNGYKLCDMAGNVCEWCADEYDGDYYGINPGVIRNPKGPGVAVTFRNDDFTNVIISRVLRGGGWYYLGWHSLRVAYRSGDSPYRSNYGIGFRCCASRSN